MFDTISHSDREKRIPAHIEKSVIPFNVTRFQHFLPNGKNSILNVLRRGLPLL
ncbi:Uncharacterised protein [Streptococcus pneumoniae]|nr:Uncharacterised protein [Streptococcus pneumoniae]